MADPLPRNSSADENRQQIERRLNPPNNRVRMPGEPPPPRPPLRNPPDVPHRPAGEEQPNPPPPRPYPGIFPPARFGVSQRNEDQRRRIENAAPLPQNTTTEMRAAARQAEAERAAQRQREIAQNLNRRIGHAVEASNLWADRLKAWLALIGVIAALLVVPRWITDAVSTPSPVPIVTAAVGVGAILPPPITITPSSQTAAVFSPAASIPSTQSIITLAPPATATLAIPPCTITAVPVQIETTAQEIIVKALISTADCTQQTLRVSIWLTRDGRPLLAPNASAIYRTNSGQLTVQARVQTDATGLTPITLSLPRTELPLTSGQYTLGGYLNVRQWDSQTNLHDTPLPSFELTIP
jgi:hypothetical protein